MDYDKGKQLTVGELKSYLSYIPDEVKICVGIGDMLAEAHYLINDDGKLVIHPDYYMQNATEVNFYTLLSFNVKK